MCSLVAAVDSFFIALVIIVYAPEGKSTERSKGEGNIITKNEPGELGE